MANLIALEFDGDEIRVAAAQTQAKQIRIRHAFALSFTSDDSIDQIGEKLKQALSENGISRGDAIVVVPRAMVEIREIKVPPAPDNELPSLVRFKSKADFASVTENWSIDYIPLSGDETTEREVLAAALPNQESEWFASVCTAAGLKLKNVVLRPFATLDLLPKSLQQGELFLIADPNGDQIDLTLVNNGSPILTRTVRINADSDMSGLGKTLPMEIKRTLASAQRRIGNRDLSKVVLIGSDSKFGSLSEPIVEQLECKTDFVDPFSQIQLNGEMPETAEKYASLVGCLLQSGKSEPFTMDFVNAKKAVVEKKDNRRSLIIGGSIAALFLCGIFLCWSSLRGQANSIKQKNMRLTALKNENEGLVPQGSKSVVQILGEVEKVDAWMSSAPNWLDELEATSSATLDADQLVVDRFFGRIARDKTTINMAFRLKQMSTSSDLRHALADRPYGLSPSSTTANNKSKEYPVSTDLDLEIERDLDATRERMDEIANRSLYGDPPESNTEETQ